MIPRDDQHQVLAADGNGGKAQICWGTGAEHQVELLGGQAFQQMLGDIGVKGETDLLPRFGGKKFGGQGRYQIDPQCPQQPQPDHALSTRYPL